MRHYARNIGDLAAATRGLDLMHRGAYDALLDAYYLNERPLPADVRECYLLADARSPAERRAVDACLARFFTLHADGYHQKRCDTELARWMEKSESARASARLSVISREQQNRELRRQRVKAAKEKGTQSKEEWWALVAACGGACVRCGTVGVVQKDHIVPVYQGGSDSLNNIQPLCARCNSQKGPEDTDHRPGDWRANVERTLSERLPENEVGAQLPTNHEPRTTSPLPSVGKKKPPTVAAAPLPDWLPADLWARFLEARVAMKARATPHGQQLLLAELTKLRQQGHDPTGVLEQSIARSWRGLFPVRDPPQQTATKHGRRDQVAGEIWGDEHHVKPDDRTIDGTAERVA